MTINLLQATKAQTSDGRYYEGMVRPDEAQVSKKTVRAFDRVDKNGDGVLDFNEIIARRKLYQRRYIVAGVWSAAMSLFEVLSLRMSRSKVSRNLGLCCTAGFATSSVLDFILAYNSKQQTEQMIKEHENTQKLDVES